MASSVLSRLLPSTFTSWASIHITPLTLLLLSSPKANSHSCFWFSSHLPSQQHQLIQSLFLETFSSLGFCGPTLSCYFYLSLMLLLLSLTAFLPFILKMESSKAHRDFIQFLVYGSPGPPAVSMQLYFHVGEFALALPETLFSQVYSVNSSFL